MRAGIVVNVTRADRHRLEAIVLDRSAPQKYVWRANIILATADGCGLEAHQLAPHRIRTFKLSTDPKFAEKLKDVVGLYVDPPAHTVVLSVDEKSKIQALDRTPPGLPMKPGRAGTMTHDYKRHGTTTLFAALNILDGTYRPQHPGSTRSKASSPSSRASASSAACSDLSFICRSPSTASSPRQTSIPNPSSGPPTQNACSPLSNGGSKR
jgi:hypothetical protein